MEPADLQRDDQPTKPAKTTAGNENHPDRRQEGRGNVGCTNHPAAATLLPDAATAADSAVSAKPTCSDTAAAKCSAAAAASVQADAAAPTAS